MELVAHPLEAEAVDHSAGKKKTKIRKQNKTKITKTISDDAGLIEEYLARPKSGFASRIGKSLCCIN